MNTELSQEGVILKLLSGNDWQEFGVNDIAYLKPIMLQGAERYAIHAANGTPLAVMDNRDVAYAAIRQNELEPVSLH
jgi:hypothetical protein